MKASITQILLQNHAEQVMCDLFRSYRIPEEPSVELQLKILLQEAGVSSSVPSQLLQIQTHTRLQSCNTPTDHCDFDVGNNIIHWKSSSVIVVLDTL